MPEVSKGYSLTHAFKFYKDKHYRRGEEYKIDRVLYRKICCEFNKKIVEKVLAGKLFHLPHSVGTLWIKKFKIDWDNPPIDFHETKKAGKTIYHLNTHSDGWAARWAWSKRNNLVSNLLYYSFDPSFTNSRLVAKEMKKKNGHKKYFA